MKYRPLIPVASSLLIIGSFAIPVSATDDDDGGHGNHGHKITICHNGHTITIDKHAWPAHQEHGDTKGRCQEEETETTQAPTTQTPTTEASTTVATTQATPTSGTPTSGTPTSEDADQV
ncbi:MAG: hypothetical protein ABWZ17_06360, partial [Candidatus Binatia bacterium]